MAAASQALPRQQHGPLGHEGEALQLGAAGQWDVDEGLGKLLPCCRAPLQQKGGWKASG